MKRIAGLALLSLVLFLYPVSALDWYYGGKGYADSWLDDEGDVGFGNWTLIGNLTISDFLNVTGTANITVILADNGTFYLIDSTYINATYGNFTRVNISYADIVFQNSTRIWIRGSPAVNRSDLNWLAASVQANYLKLDASNDPITGRLDITNQLVVSSGGVLNLNVDVVNDRVSLDPPTQLVAGGTTAALPTYLQVRDSDLDTGTGGWYSSIYETEKTAGATDHDDYLYGFHAWMNMKQPGGEIASLYGLNTAGVLETGQIGDAVNLRELVGGRIISRLQGTGTLYGNATGLLVYVQGGATNTITHDAAGLYVDVDLDGTFNGNATMLYLNEHTGVNRGIYQNGDAPNYFGGGLRIADDVNVTGNINATSFPAGHITGWDFHTRTGIYLDSAASWLEFIDNSNAALILRTDSADYMTISTLIGDEFIRLNAGLAGTDYIADFSPSTANITFNRDLELNWHNITNVKNFNATTGNITTLNTGHININNTHLCQQGGAYCPSTLGGNTSAQIEHDIEKGLWYVHNNVTIDATLWSKQVEDRYLQGNWRFQKDGHDFGPYNHSAILFAPITGYALTNNRANISQHLGNFTKPASITVAAWIRITDPSQTGTSILGMSDKTKAYLGGSDTYWELLSGDGSSDNIFVRIRQTGADVLKWASTATYNDNSWHFVVVNASSTGCRVYIDGVYDAGTYATGNSGTNCGPGQLTGLNSALIGAIRFSNGWQISSICKGLISDASFYSRGLSAYEIRRLYDSNIHYPSLSDVGFGAISLGGSNVYAISRYLINTSDGATMVLNGPKRGLVRYRNDADNEAQNINAVDLYLKNGNAGGIQNIINAELVNRQSVSPNHAANFSEICTDTSFPNYDCTTVLLRSYYNDGDFGYPLYENALRILQGHIYLPNDYGLKWGGITNRFYLNSTGADTFRFVIGSSTALILNASDARFTDDVIADDFLTFSTVWDETKLGNASQYIKPGSELTDAAGKADDSKLSPLEQVPMQVINESSCVDNIIGYKNVTTKDGWKLVPIINRTCDYMTDILHSIGGSVAKHEQSLYEILQKLKTMTGVSIDLTPLWDAIAAVQQKDVEQDGRITVLEQTVADQDKRIKTLEEELCKHDPTFSWCGAIMP